MSGFTLKQTQSDSGTEGKVYEYNVDSGHATLLAPGDVVRITGGASTEGKPQVDAATAGQSITGIISAIKPNFVGEALTETGLVASTEGDVSVHVDPNSLFEVDVSNGPLVAADVGLNADCLPTAATKAGGITVSNMTLNATGKATTATLQFRIVALLEDEDGTLGNRAIVRINNSTIRAGAAGVQEIDYGY